MQDEERGVWREGTNDMTDFYFCLTNLQVNFIFGSNDDNEEPLLSLIYFKNRFFDITDIYKAQQHLL